jgi:hypothetical protein
MIKAVPLIGAACVEVQDGNATDGTPIESNGQIVGLGGKCLEMMGTGASIKTSLTLSKCTAAIAQQWVLQ